MSTDLLERTETEERVHLDIRNHEKLVPDDGSNKDKLAHLAFKDAIAEAIFNGTPVTAFCGYVWVPSMDPPKQYPVCQECKERYDNTEFGVPHGPEDGPTWDAE